MHSQCINIHRKETEIIPNENVATIGELIKMLSKYDPDSKVQICVYVPEMNCYASIEGLTVTAERGVVLYGMEGF